MLVITLTVTIRDSRHDLGYRPRQAEVIEVRKTCGSETGPQALLYNTRFFEFRWM
ncbi:MAG: hypothetical protein ABSH50_10400 [Bryobacteraceae bacterium]|jgi:hypothetical protein